MLLLCAPPQHYGRRACRSSCGPFCNTDRADTHVAPVLFWEGVSSFCEGVPSFCEGVTPCKWGNHFASAIALYCWCRRRVKQALKKRSKSAPQRGGALSVCPLRTDLCRREMVSHGPPGHPQTGGCSHCTWLQGISFPSLKCRRLPPALWYTEWPIGSHSVFQWMCCPQGGNSLRLPWGQHTNDDRAHYPGLCQA